MKRVAVRRGSLLSTMRRLTPGHTPPQPRLAALVGVLLCCSLLMGCTVDVLYRAEEVIPPESPPIEAQSAASLPFILDILRTFDSAPKAAIYERMKYKRTMGLVHVEKGCKQEQEAE